MTVRYYGLGQGEQYSTIAQAWDSYHTHVLGGKPMQAEEYHERRLAFVFGALCGINVLGTRFAANEPMRPEQLMAVIQECVNDFTKASLEEYRHVSNYRK